MKELLGLLKREFPHVDWNSDKRLVEDGVIDSMDIVAVISEITSCYDIEIPSEEMEPVNFNSVEAIWKLIGRLKED